MYPIVLLIYAVCLLILEIVAIASEILRENHDYPFTGANILIVWRLKNILYAYAQIFVLSLVHYELGLCLMEDS